MTPQPLTGCPKPPERGPIWRAVVSEMVRYNPGYAKSWAVGGVRVLELLCGHTSPRKLSTGTPKKVRCRVCESRRAGSVVTLSHADGSKTVEDWDAERQLPRRVTSKAPQPLTGCPGWFYVWAERKAYVLAEWKVSSGLLSEARCDFDAVALVKGSPAYCRATFPAILNPVPYGENLLRRAVLTRTGWDLPKADRETDRARVEYAVARVKADKNAERLEIDGGRLSATRKDLPEPFGPFWVWEGLLVGPVLFKP